MNELQAFADDLTRPPSFRFGDMVRRVGQKEVWLVTGTEIRQRIGGGTVEIVGLARHKQGSELPAAQLERV